MIEITNPEIFAQKLTDVSANTAIEFGAAYKCAARVNGQPFSVHTKETIRSEYRLNYHANIPFRASIECYLFRRSFNCSIGGQFTVKDIDGSSHIVRTNWEYTAYINDGFALMDRVDAAENAQLDDFTWFGMLRDTCLKRYFEEALQNRALMTSVKLLDTAESKEAIAKEVADKYFRNGGERQYGVRLDAFVCGGMTIE